MKKLFCVLMTLAMLLGVSACNGSPKQEEEQAVEEGFVPSLDTASECSINVAGGYDNFEALEAEFDRFNEFYPMWN